MNKTFACEIDSGYFGDGSRHPYGSIIDEYERVVVKSLITSFGLDFLVTDRHGGDVDTVFNVRKIGVDEELTYKNSENAIDYENRGEYDVAAYHSDSRFAGIKHKAREEWRKTGVDLIDEYAGGRIGFPGHTKSVPSNRKAELDHTVECKTIHDDRGRVLAGLDGVDLANDSENLHWTNKEFNASMGAWQRQENERYKKCHGGQNAPEELLGAEAYVNAHPELDDGTKKNLLKYYKKSKKSIDRKISVAYYTSDRFWKDSFQAAGTVGLRMGIRQALGFVMSELWFATRDEFRRGFNSIEELLERLGDGIKNGLDRAKVKYKKIFQEILDGAVSGALSSITTTVCNIFFTTAKNFVKILRQCWVSLCEAAKVLFINPDHLPFSEKLRSVAKILATGASVVVGTMVGEAIGKFVGAIPVAGECVTVFCSSLVTGLLSCTLLYYLDRSDVFRRVQELFTTQADITLEQMKERAEALRMVYARLMELDIDKFKAECEKFNNLIDSLTVVRDNPFELERRLDKAISSFGLKHMIGGHETVRDFMMDPDAELVLS